MLTNLSLWVRWAGGAAGEAEAGAGGGSTATGGWAEKAKTVG